MTQLAVRRALISVYDKTGLEDLGLALQAAGVQIVSTGSTAARLRDAGVAVTPVEELTGFPECLDGRVKTLHPRVHAGILADRRKPAHVAQLAELGIDAFDLVVVNLYPFRETVAAGAGEDDVVEQIDIGGPSMVRAAAKNHPSVAVVVDPDRYADVVAAVQAGGFDLPTRRDLAATAFAHTAAYDAAVAEWFASPGGGSAPDPVEEGELPPYLSVSLERAEVLRYGENPHQRAALYVRLGEPPGLAHAEQLHGKAMSYNNFVDGDAARRAAYDHAEPCVAIIKHANPCGIAVDEDIARAHAKAHACDPVSAFGGVIAANRPVSRAMAEQVADVFTEVLIAPAFDDGALAVLRAKKNIRLLLCPAPTAAGAELRQVSGGVLVQQPDRLDAAGDDPAGWTLAGDTAADGPALADLAFAWRAIRAVRSNAILLAYDRATVGIGMGQVNRVDAARLAVARAGDRAVGAVAAGDAFFPFPDGLQVLLDAGVRAVVHPGGSVRDDEVQAAAHAVGVPVYLTGARHFTH
ncbi:MAG: bifunctional phosphoribosylaminoimidazolecarboxamide formyltransferase/IMP cyclohydrolase [Geodermatophilaceae bacterium]|nr:bifunctional phosphoribosylaminoimidazolecarboxamide formyltransferase/IMP cyclohydrolase [Geodermatophilaceae bacterium]